MMRLDKAFKRALFMLCALVLLGAGQSIASDDPPPRILVTGEGSVDIAPDMAVLSLVVMREAPSARAAVTANSNAMKKVLDAMAKLGIDKRDLQTSGFSIQPRYSRPPRQGAGSGEAPKLVSYTVRNSLTVRVRDIARVGEVLDTSVTLGVNEGGNILFTNDDASAALTQARVKAVEDAMSRGNTLAKAAGVKAGRVLEISEQNFSPRPMPMARGMVAADSFAESVPVAAGENTYKVMVSLTLAIEQ